MSKKQKKSVQPIPEPIGISTWIPKIGVFMAIVLAALVTFYSQTKPIPVSTPTPSAVVSSSSPTKAIDPGPTPEQERWIRERLLHDCDRIAANYPIVDIRQKFAAFVQRLARKDVLMQC